MVTGGAQGIGRAITERLLADGARVAVFDLDPAEAPDEALALTCDVRDPSAVHAATDAAKRELGSLDFLVNNAGIRFRASAGGHTDEQWRDTLDVNVTGTYFCIRAALPHLFEAAEGGRIVNLGSIVGQVGAPERVAYCTSKAAVEGMTRALAVELAGDGVCVNAVAPGVIETPLTREYFSDPERTALIVGGTPARRWGQPDEVAGAVAFLVGPDARFVNGVTLYVDGGWAAGKDV